MNNYTTTTMNGRYTTNLDTDNTSVDGANALAIFITITIFVVIVLFITRTKQ